MIDYRLDRRVPACWVGLALAFAAAPGRAQTVGGYTITTVVGTAGFGSGYAGDGASVASAQFNGLYSLTVDSSGNLIIVDQFNDRIRKVSGGNINTIAGDGVGGYFGDNGAATSAEV